MENEKLREFVRSLNSENNTVFVYVDPEDVNNFVVTSRDWGVPEGYKCLGSLESLSPTIDFFAELKEYLINCNCIVEYRGRKVKVSPEGIVENFDLLDDAFREFLEQEMEEWLEIAHEAQADFILDQHLEELEEDELEELEEHEWEPELEE